MFTLMVYWDMKNIYITLVVVILAGFGLYTFSNYGVTDTKGKDTTYVVDGIKVTLRDGSSEEVIPGTNTVVTTKYFGNDVSYDFDKDGRKDTAFLLTHQTGGSGTFYYVVAALNTKDGYVGSQGMLLGDRIAPQTTSVDSKGIVTVNYADRKAGDSFAVAPSVGKSIQLLLDTKLMQFGEVVKDFEGEADPSRMKLNMKTWNWVKTEYSDGKMATPRTDKFTISFKDAKTFSATTDCNGVGGEYLIDGNKISFSKMVSTQMYCEKSQESDFTKMLSETQSYMFTSKGELVLSLKMDSGSVIFR